MHEGSPNILASLFLLVIEIVLCILIIAGFWRIFEKAGKPGWASIIPIYNIFVMIEIAGYPWWCFFLYLIPFVNIVILALVFVGLVKRFGKPAWHALLAVLFSFIYLPYLGFSDAQYQSGEGNVAVWP
ncbi:MAG: DUF5684 domain-containing protein [Chloroflexi bacterium]|nr:DUF5684 domain-containing protein [Chloroflexota bacterium]